jgi:orotidine-5'-phosphate decarboxylase
MSISSAAATDLFDRRPVRACAIADRDLPTKDPDLLVKGACSRRNSAGGLGRRRFPAVPSPATTAAAVSPMPPSRDVPRNIEDRLIAALDVPTIAEARALVDRLDGAISFFKLGLWLQFAAGFDGLIEELLKRGKKVFLDAKMFDIGETVKQGVARAAERGVAFVTVHGDGDIIKAAIDGKGGAPIKIFAITALTSLDSDGLRELGYLCGVDELIRLRVERAVACGCDGIIAAPHDDPNRIRRLAGAHSLLVATPGVRLAGSAADDHKRAGTPAQAIAAGADYLVVGRPITRSDDPAAAARRIIDDMRSAA